MERVWLEFLGRSLWGLKGLGQKVEGFMYIFLIIMIIIIDFFGGEGMCALNPNKS